MVDPVDHCARRNANHGEPRCLRLDNRDSEGLVGHARDIKVSARQPARQLGAAFDIARRVQPRRISQEELRAQRAVAEQDEMRAKAVGEQKESIDHRLRALLAIEATSVDQQRRVVGNAKLAADCGIAPVRRKFAQLDPQRHHFDRVEPEVAQLRRAAIFGQSVNQVEATIEFPAIPIAKP